MPPPVLLIHGCNGSWRDWESQSGPRSWVVGRPSVQISGTTPRGATWELLEADPNSHPVRAAVFLLDYSSARTPIDDLCHAVAAAVRETKRLASENMVVLIGHSMGGLLARAYVQDLAGIGQYQNDVAALYTLASPNNGARIVGFIGSLVSSLICPQSWGLNPTSGVLNTLNQKSLPPNMHCATITGVACRSRWGGFHDGILFADDTLLRATPANGFVASFIDDLQHTVTGNPVCSGHPGVIPASVNPLEQLYDSQFP